MSQASANTTLRSERGTGAIRALITLLLVVSVAYGAFKLIPVRAAAFQFDDTVREQVVLAGARRRPISDQRLREEILLRAKELGIPIDRRDVVIRRGRDRVQIVVEYAVRVQLVFGYEFDWNFRADHDGPVF